MPIFDAHLDLAYNVTRGRDVTKPAIEQPKVRDEIATCGFPDLRAADVRAICATIFCSPGGYGGRKGYTTPDEAHAAAMVQFEQYQSWVKQGLIERVDCRSDLSRIRISPISNAHRRDPDATDPIKAILLMEGADAIRSREDLADFHACGLRIVGLAWQRTRHAGGTGAPGPLTNEGRQLVKWLDELAIIHDTSHLADESFWELLERTTGPVMASHSNCRAIVPSDRQISDSMIKAIAARGGVIGINFYDEFLVPPDQFGARRCSLSDVIAHLKHMTDLIGDARHVALGTDLDGGVGRDDIPHELSTAGDLPKVAQALRDANFSDTDVSNIMWGNWLRFFTTSLPSTDSRA